MSFQTTSVVVISGYHNRQKNEMVNLCRTAIHDEK